MIPDEAVEAAEDAARAVGAEFDFLAKWAGRGPAYQRIYRERVTRILEAAAPHMLAEASAPVTPEPPNATSNPYRREV